MTFPTSFPMIDACQTIAGGGANLGLDFGFYRAWFDRVISNIRVELYVVLFSRLTWRVDRWRRYNE